MGLSGPTIAVLVVGFSATFAFGLAARTAHDDDETRLAVQRAREATAVLGAGIPSVAAPLMCQAGEG